MPLYLSFPLRPLLPVKVTEHKHRTLAFSHFPRQGRGSQSCRSCSPPLGNWQGWGFPIRNLGPVVTDQHPRS